ncbi:MAG: hypothetical protein CME06_18145 [Gemmatimonadetes bacterium]|nr:hypothetical protein [Gemmatimonadota bacterium]
MLWLEPTALLDTLVDRATEGASSGCDPQAGVLRELQEARGRALRERGAALRTALLDLELRTSEHSLWMGAERASGITALDSADPIGAAIAGHPAPRIGARARFEAARLACVDQNPPRAAQEDLVVALLADPKGENVPRILVDVARIQLTELRFDRLDAWVRAALALPCAPRAELLYLAGQGSEARLRWYEAEDRYRMAGDNIRPGMEDLGRDVEAGLRRVGNLARAEPLGIPVERLATIRGLGGIDTLLAIADGRLHRIRAEAGQSLAVDEGVALPATIRGQVLGFWAFDTEDQTAPRSTTYAIHVAPRGGGNSRFILLELEDRGPAVELVQLGRIELNTTRARAVCADLEGDGEPEIVVGTNYPAYEFLVLARGCASELPFYTPMENMSRRGDDIDCVAALDLDDDGRDELLVGRGGWHTNVTEVLSLQGASVCSGMLESIQTLRIGALQLVTNHRATIPFVALPSTDGVLLARGRGGAALRQTHLPPGVHLYEVENSRLRRALSAYLPPWHRHPSQESPAGFGIATLSTMAGAVGSDPATVLWARAQSPPATYRIELDGATPVHIQPYQLIPAPMLDLPIVELDGDPTPELLIVDAKHPSRAALEALGPRAGGWAVPL